MEFFLFTDELWQLRMLTLRRNQKYNDYGNLESNSQAQI